MLYKFKSKAAADLIMLGEQGDELLRMVGREPSAQGIFEVTALPAVIAALEAAVARSEQAPAAAADKGEDDGHAGARAVSLRQRAWPLRELLRRAHEAQQVVVWGV
jgi:hypothetical protein